MQTILFLIFFPLLVSLVLYLTKNKKVRIYTARIAAVVLTAGVLYLTWQYFNIPQQQFAVQAGVANYLFLALDFVICGIIIYNSIKYKRVLPLVLSVVQTVAIALYELLWKDETAVGAYLFVDKLSVILALIIGIIGSLICLFAISYMEDFHHHHPEYADRRNQFLALLFVVISAMFGIVFSNNLIWMSVFWEVTTLASFLFIKYTETKEAVKNGFTALNLNLIGGVTFVAGIMIMGLAFGIHEISEVVASVSLGEPLFSLAILCFAIAGLSKAAQIPFSKWLLGAMVAPTPTSALLHSSTMVKAGVYLLIRLSPKITENPYVSITVILIGGFTFLLASILAISQTDGKKTLAYSTIANLGLIVTCAGVGGYEALWAGILLMIFHAIAKSLLFLCVGTIEHKLGSRDIEDMHGLIVKLPLLAFFMAVGIAGMFLAPFGMLISKWATLKALVDSRNILFVVILAFGSAATLFYWTKWLGNIVAVLPKSERIPYKMNLDVRVTFSIQAGLTMLLCLFFPVVSQYMIGPFLTEVFHFPDMTVISSGNQIIMTIMLGMIVILPLALRFISLKDDRITSAYMGGVNAGDGRHFIDAHGEKKRLYLSNWYMQDIIHEKSIMTVSASLATLLMCACVIFLLGGVL